MVVAAGRSERFGRPKQWEELGGRPMLAWSLAAARSVADGVVLVLPEEHAARRADNEQTSRCLADTVVQARIPPPLPDAVVAGGATRSASVRAGLFAVPEDAAIVVVHDAARPLASPELFASVVEAVSGGAAGAVPAIPVSDTIKRVSGARVVETLDREVLVAVQTPQAFSVEVLRRAHETSADATDDASLVEALGLEVAVVPGDPRNLKVTYPLDLEIAESILSSIGGGGARPMLRSS